jgi:hypothetical protein
MSLYGYPTQYALPLLLLSAVAYAESCNTGGGWRWLALSGVAFCGLALMKVDFAMAGTLLVAVAIIQRRILDRKTWVIPVFVLLAVGLIYAVQRLALDGDPWDFVSSFNEKHPFAPNTRHSIRALYACGVGTFALWLVTIIAGLLRRDERGNTFRIIAGWAIAALPLWVFWMGHPPMTTRHVVPAAVVTALFAALTASRTFGRFRYLPAVWGMALVAINWPFGTPGLDINNFPSGDLIQSVSSNRKAFRVVDDIARQIADVREPVKVIVGRRQREAFGGIDFIPTIQVEMASRSKSSRAVKLNVSGGYLQEFTDHDGFTTILYPYIPAGPYARFVGRRKNAGYYSFWSVDLAPLEQEGFPVKQFHPVEMLEKLGGG